MFLFFQGSQNIGGNVKGCCKEFKKKSKKIYKKIITTTLSEGIIGEYLAKVQKI